MALLLQETRGPCKVLDYTTFSDPSISSQARSSHGPTLGLAVVLVHKSCHTVQHRWGQACNDDREVIMVLVTPPGGKSVLLVSVYYKPRSGAVPPSLYDWIPYIFSLRFTGPIIMGETSTLVITLWGYLSTNCRGRLLEQTLE